MTVAATRGVSATGGAFAVLGSVVGVATGNGGTWWAEGVAFTASMAVFLSLFAWLAVPRQPRNSVVVIMAVGGLLLGVHVIGRVVVALLLSGHPELVVGMAATVVPANLPRSAAWVLLISEPWSILGLFLWLTLGLLLFPDGQLPSRRWRWVAVAAVLGNVVTTAASAWSFRPDNAALANAGGLINLGVMTLVATMVLCLLSLVVRFRRSTGTTRQQFKWIVWGASVFVPVIVLGALLGGTPAEELVALPIILGGAVMVGSYGIAVGRYRLYDIDVVINRTLVFVGLAGVITAIYAVIAVGIGSLMGGSSLVLATVATAVVAVVFEPIRARMQRWANLAVYGRRASPYDVLSEVTRRLATSEDEDGILVRMAAMLAAGAGADRAVVWLAEDDGFVAAASDPAHLVGAAVPDRVGLPGEAVLIEHDGRVLGALTVEKARGDVVTSTERRLVEDLAGSAAPLLHKLRLDAELETKARELAESRRRLVDAQDIERRRLERELRDGAQQRIVSMADELGVVRQVAEREGSPRAVALIDQMAGDTRAAMDQVRSLARGIYPPLLEAEGLPAAVAALAESSPLDVGIEVHLARRHAPQHESAAYFCISEALTNASKHARGPVVVRVADDRTSLRFEVADSGPGFDPETVRPGSGTRNLTDRVEALGGTLVVESRPGSSTTVVGTLPTTSASPAGPGQGVAAQAAASS